MFERAYNMAPDIPRLAGNYALALAQKGRGYLLFKNSEDDKILNKSEAIFNRILKENSAEAVSYAQAAVAFYYHRKYEEAWDKLCTALKMGGEKSVNPSFIEDLKRKMPSPCENL